MNPNKAGLAVGGLMGLWHFVWGLFVVFGIAQALLDWIYSLHFLNNPFTVHVFNIVQWITLIVVTAIVGYIFGYVFAIIWNKVNK